MYDNRPKAIYKYELHMKCEMKNRCTQLTNRFDFIFHCQNMWKMRTEMWFLFMMYKKRAKMPWCEQFIKIMHFETISYVYLNYRYQLNSITSKWTQLQIRCSLLILIWWIWFPSCFLRGFISFVASFFRIYLRYGVYHIFRKNTSIMIC